MAFNWSAAAILIAGLDGRAHYRAEPSEEPFAVGVRVLSGRLIAPAALVAPLGEHCPDCRATRHATAAKARPRRGARPWRKPYLQAVVRGLRPGGPRTVWGAP
jgi:hypothetical protein